MEIRPGVRPWSKLWSGGTVHSETRWGMAPEKLISTSPGVYLEID